MRKIFVFLGIVLVMIACAPQTENSEGLTIGLLVTLTGPAAIHGTHVAMGAEKAVEELNAQGAGITLLIEDNKNQPKEGITAYQKLKSADIIFTTMSGASASVIPLVQEDNKPVVTSLTYADFQEYDNVYQYFQTTQDLTTLAAEFFKEKGIEKVGLLSTNIEAGHALMDIAEKKFVEEGVSIVGIEYYTAGDPDQKTQILKLVDKEPDAIYVFDLRPDLIVKQIKDQYNGKIVFTDVPVATNLHKTIDELDGVYAAAQLYMIEGTEQNVKFEELFGSQDGNAEAGFGYDVINLIWKASQNGELPGSILDLKEFTGLAGTIDLDLSRKPTIPVKMVLIKDKKLELI